jgi:hypothetical protein
MQLTQQDYVNSMTIATVIILSHKAQNPLRANDYHIIAPVIITHTFISIIPNGPKSINRKLSLISYKPTLLIIQHIDAIVRSSKLSGITFIGALLCKSH